MEVRDTFTRKITLSLISPKTYGAFNEVKKIVDGLTRKKGVPKKAKMLDYDIDPITFVGEITFSYPTPMRFRQAIRREFEINQWVESEKTISSDVIKRKFDGLDSMPIEVNDKELHMDILEFTGEKEEENET